MAPSNDRRQHATPGSGDHARGLRILVCYLAFVALACTAAPLFVHPDVNVLLALVQIPLALWAVHRHGQNDDHTIALTSDEEPWS